MGISYEDRKRELFLSMRYMERMHDLWRQYEQIYRNGATWDFFTRTGFDKEIVTVNYAYSNARTLLALLLPPKMRIVVKAKHPGKAKKAQVVEKVLQFLWEKMDVEDEYGRLLLDAIVFSDGFWKTGFGSLYGDPEEDAPPKDPIEARMREILSLKPIYPDEEPYRKGEGGLAVETMDNVFSAMPWLNRLAPYDLFPDYCADKIRDGRFIVHRYTRTLDDAKRDPTLERRNQLRATGMLQMNGDGLRWNVYRSSPRSGRVIEGAIFDADMKGGYNAEIVDFYEFWDKRTRKAYTITEGASGYHKMREWYPEIWGFPIGHMQLNLSPGDLFGIGEVGPIAGQQLELNRMRIFAMLHWKMACLGRVLANRDAAPDQQTYQKIVNPDILSVVEVNDKDGFTVLQLPPLNPEIYALEDRMVRDIRNVGAAGESQRGQITGATASEVDIVQQNFDLITEIRRKRVRKGARQGLEMLFELWRDRITQGQLTRIAGPEAAAIIVANEENEGPGDYDIDIVAEESLEANLAVRRKQLVEFTNLSAELVLKIAAPINIMPLYRHCLETFDIPDRETIAPEETVALVGQQALQRALMASGGGAPPGGDGAPAGGGPPQNGGNGKAATPFGQSGGLLPPGELNAPFPTRGEEMAGAQGAVTRKRGRF